MKNILKYIAITSFFLTFVSCAGADEIIELPMNDMSGKVVIEGSVTDAPGPYYVRVTKSIKISAGNSYQPISNAVVVLKDDNGQSETLRYHDGKYRTENFHTDYGRTYTLTVTMEGTTYKATSKMPALVNLDNVQQTIVGDSIGIVPVFTDPATLGNNYIFKSYIGSKSSDINFLSDSDNNNKINNGETNTQNIPLKNSPKKNDTVIVEMQSVDEPVYKYFKKLVKVGLGSLGDAAVVNPPSNFNNGALGYFSAYASSVKFTIIH